MNIVALKNITKTYIQGTTTCPVLQDLSLEINKGSFTAITGKSGSGKSTLINIMSGIERATEGEVYIEGTDLQSLTENKRAQLRGREIGIVFQFFQLLPTLTILENIVLALDFCKKCPREQHKRRSLELLEKMGIADQAYKFPAELSGGQQQRAAIARALANDPALLIADEPTGNLDQTTTESILSIFTSLVKEGKTIIMVTHEPDINHWAERVITIKDGHIEYDHKKEVKNEG